MRFMPHPRRAIPIAAAFYLTVLAPAPGQAQSLSGDQMKAGQRLFFRCQTCHEVKAGAPNKVGPNLNKLFGKKAAIVPGYGYSAALRNSGVVWSDATLDKWLAKPSGLAPGTTMAFVGLPKPEERALLIAYLKQATK